MQTDWCCIDSFRYVFKKRTHWVLKTSLTLFYGDSVVERRSWQMLRNLQAVVLCISTLKPAEFKQGSQHQTLSNLLWSGNGWWCLALVSIWTAFLAPFLGLFHLILQLQLYLLTHPRRRYANLLIICRLLGKCGHKLQRGVLFLIKC